MKFNADKKAPYFSYFLKLNSREKKPDVQAVLEDVLKKAEILIEQETPQQDMTQ